MLAEEDTRAMLAERRAQVATEHRGTPSEIHGLARLAEAVRRVTTG